MRAHVLLNLLNERGKRDKMRGLSSILSLFRNEFNKFNNTRAQMLAVLQGCLQFVTDHTHLLFFYLSYGIKITLKSHFCRKNVNKNLIL